MPICTGCERPYDNGTNGLHACDERDRIDVLERQVDRLSRWIVDHERYVTGARDHACAECVPGGPIVSKTFICARHLARAIHKAIADRQEHEDATASVRPAPTPCQCPEVEQGTVYFCGLHDVPNEKGEYGEGQDRACVRGEMRPRGVPGVASELHRSSGTSTEALPQRGVDDQKRVGVDLPRVRGAQDVDPRPSDAPPPMYSEDYCREYGCSHVGRRPNDASPEGLPSVVRFVLRKYEISNVGHYDPMLADALEALRSVAVRTGVIKGEPHERAEQRTDEALPLVDQIVALVEDNMPLEVEARVRQRIGELLAGARPETPVVDPRLDVLEAAIRICREVSDEWELNGVQSGQQAADECAMLLADFRKTFEAPPTGSTDK